MTSREPTGQAISDEAATAAGRALLQSLGYEPAEGRPIGTAWMNAGRVMVAAALPHIRAEISDEILAAIDALTLVKPYLDNSYTWQRGWNFGVDAAARVARGGPTE